MCCCCCAAGEGRQPPRDRQRAARSACRQRVCRPALGACGAGHRARVPAPLTSLFFFCADTPCNGKCVVELPRPLKCRTCAAAFCQQWPISYTSSLSIMYNSQAAAGDATRDLFAAAMRKREQLFSDSQASTLEGWVHTTKALRPEVPAAARPDSAAAAPGGAATPSKKLPDVSALVAAAATSRPEPIGNGTAEVAPVAKSAPPPPPPPAEAEPVAAHQVQHAAAAAAVPDAVLGGYDPFMAAHGATQHEEQAQQQADTGYYVQPAAPQPHYASASSVQSANGRTMPGENQAPSTAQPAETSALSSAILGDVNSLLQCVLLPGCPLLTLPEVVACECCMCTLSMNESSCIRRRRHLCLVLDLVSSQLT
jgi:hypothetical protein